MFNSLIPIVFVLIILILVVLLKVIPRQKAQGTQHYPYEKKQSLFSPAERSFLGVLELADNGRYCFMGKVRLADIVKVKSGMDKSERQKAFNKIQSKHVDIVACDPATLSVQFVIELDDSTHGQSIRQTRDEFVDNTLQAAGIPIIHFTVKKNYSVQEIQSVLSRYA